MVKKIHYCWFGSELPDSVKRNIEHWAKLNPDYELCEWKKAFNHGFDLSIQAHALKHMLKWASRPRRTWLSARNNEFTECYLAAKAKKKQAFDISGIYDTPTPYQ